MERRTRRTDGQPLPSRISKAAQQSHDCWFCQCAFTVRHNRLGWGQGADGLPFPQFRFSPEVRGRAHVWDAGSYGVPFLGVVLALHFYFSFLVRVRGEAATLHVCLLCSVSCGRCFFKRPEGLLNGRVENQAPRAAGRTRRKTGSRAPRSKKQLVHQPKNCRAPTPVQSSCKSELAGYEGAAQWYGGRTGYAFRPKGSSTISSPTACAVVRSMGDGQVDAETVTSDS